MTFNWKPTATFSVLLALALAVLQACAQPKKPGNVATLKKTTPSSGAADVGASAQNAVSILGQSYARFADKNGQMSQTQLTHVLRQFGGSAIDPTLLNMVYDQTPGKNERLSLQELSSRVPTLAWQNQDGKPLAFSDLDAKLLRTFPASTQAARDPLVAVLQRYDSKWAGGDADQRLSQGELLTAGVILGWFQRANFSKGAPVPPSCADTATMSQLAQTKVAQQIFVDYQASRSNAATALNLSADDIQLEWTQLFLKLMLVGQQIKGFSGGSVAATDLPAFLKEWKVDDQGFREDGSGKLDQLQAFNLLTSALFAQSVYAAFENSMTPASAAKHPDKVAALARIYPKTGAVVVPEDFWKSFDIVSLDTMNITEMVFVNYDANQDLKLQRTEAQAALAALGVAADKQDQALMVLYALSAELTPSQLFAGMQSYKRSSAP